MQLWMGLPTHARGAGAMSGSRRSRSTLLGIVAVAVVGLAAAPVAEATFHEIKVREVRPSATDGSYVVLQAYNGGQNFLNTHSMKQYDSTGALIHTSTFTSSPA